MGGGAWWAAVHGVTKSRIRLSDFTFTFYFHALEKQMTTHSSVLAWRIPGMVEPGGLPSMGSHRVGHNWSDLAAAAADIIVSSMSVTFWILLRPFWLFSSLQIFSAAAKSLQLCPTLCDPIDSTPPGSPIPRILQARTLEWVAISFSNAWK